MGGLRRLVSAHAVQKDGVLVMRIVRISALSLIAALLFATIFPAGGARAADAGAAVHGTLVDAATGLALAGATVQTEGPTVVTTTTDRQGRFTISGLVPGYYALLVTFTGYVTTESEPFKVEVGPAQILTLSIQRGQGASSSTRVLGTTTVR